MAVLGEAATADSGTEAEVGGDAVEVEGETVEAEVEAWAAVSDRQGERSEGVRRAS